MNYNILDFVKILYALAWADNKLQKEELILLDQIIDDFELDDSQRKIVQSWAKNAITLKDLKDINFNSFPLEQKKYILTLAVAIAKSDGIVTKDEKEFIEEMKTLLDLNYLTLDDLLNEIKASQELYGGI
jgi:DnaJ-domain-containing protein 1